jgi:hypothetical protein
MFGNGRPHPCHRTRRSQSAISGRYSTRSSAPHIDRVYAQYWAAYLIDFESQEHIIAAESKLTALRLVDGRPVPETDPGPRRPSYRGEVATTTEVAFVFALWPSDHNREKRRRAMAQLKRLGFRRERFGDLVLFVPARHAWVPDE